MNSTTHYDSLKIASNAAFSLAELPTRDDTLFARKSDARASLQADQDQIAALQDMFYAVKNHAMLIVLQGMDTSGKSGTLKTVFAKTSPEGMAVQAFKKPTPEELAHDYLWRAHKAAPKKGDIVVFDRSHYEDVLVVKVKGFASPEAIENRYRQINEFERMLTENGTIILKFMLNISHAEQGERLHDRLVLPRKQWKFNPGDLEDRALWPDFMAAYEAMVQKCSTDHAPWYVIPADSRSRRNAAIAGIVRARLEGLGLDWPTAEHTLADFEGQI